jgi:ABC-type oligopeptide transport system substrate-binding subunit
MPLSVSARFCCSGKVDHKSMRDLGKTRKFAAVICLLVAALLAGCDKDNSSLESDRVLRRGLSGEPESLDPHKFASNQSADILRDLGEGLVAYSPDGNLIAGTAESWDLSEDGLTYRFKIREEARWSNGGKVTADDFVFALRRLVDPTTAAPNAALVEAIKNAREVMSGEAPKESLGVTAVDDSSLAIVLHSPTPYFLQLLTHPATFPMHSSSLDGGKINFDQSGGFVTNGPYKLDKWDIGSSVRVVRNSAYWDNEQTFFDEVIWVAVDDLEETNRFRAGELDTTGNVSASVFDKVRKTHLGELLISPNLGVYFYGFNFDNELFASNLEIRRALSLAIDRQSIVASITRRGEEAAYGWVPPGIEGYDNQTLDYASWSKSQREAEAVRLYKASGYDEESPLRFELRYNTSDMQQTIALAIQSMWHEVLGAEVTLVNEEFRVLLANIQERKVTDVFRLSWTGDFNDPYAFLRLMESSNPSNFMGFSSPLVDEHLKAAAVELDVDLRMEHLAQAESMILQSHVVIPIYFHVSKHLVRSNLSGWEDNVLDVHYSKDLSRVRSD